MKIHFICRGNVLRSLIADTYLKSLQLSNVVVQSSGTVADIYRESNEFFFSSSVALLKDHGLEAYTKSSPEQLTQARADDQDVTICMNEIVLEEARAIVSLPFNTLVWNITDIGEGTRLIQNNDRRPVEEIIFREIITRVDTLVREYSL
jgi:protein-tyrosine-phosphatase